MTDVIDFDVEQQLDREFVADEPFTPTISVPRHIVPKAVKHGMELWWDGSTPTKRLDTRKDSSQFTRFVNARVEGKVAEVAFAKFLYVFFDIESQIDWRIYGDYNQTDEGDLQYLLGDDGGEHVPACEFDIKKTKPWNQWLAIRKTIYDRLEDDAPVVLTKLRIEEELSVDPWEDVGEWTTVEADDSFKTRLVDFALDEFPIDVDIVGSVYPDEFTDYFDAGDRLYDPDTGSELGGPLRCQNKGVHTTNLSCTPSRWNRVVDDIVGEHPITWNPLAITVASNDDS